MNEENKVYPVTFHFYTFTTAKLNYDIYDKKLLAIFEAFKILNDWMDLHDQTCIGVYSSNCF